MSDDAGNRPAYRGVGRGEGISTYKEAACAGAGKGTFTSGSEFEDFSVEECSYGSFSGELNCAAFSASLRKLKLKLPRIAPLPGFVMISIRPKPDRLYSVVNGFVLIRISRI